VLKLDLLAPVGAASLATVARFVVLRVFFLSQYMAAHYMFLVLFGLDVPVERLLVYLPLLTFVQIIPVTISGLGTTQLVMRHFYSPFVAAGTAHPAAVVDAFSTAGILGFVLFRVLVAYFFLGEFSREVIRGADKVKVSTAD